MAVRIVIFAKVPLAGVAKTRLIPALGLQGSAQLAKRLLIHTVEQALAANIGPTELCVSPSTLHSAWQELPLPAALAWSEQGQGDLGERLARASQRVTSSGESILLIGSDCPSLTAERLREAALALECHDTCMVPVSDGGYALLGMNRHLPSIFSDMLWSTDTVARFTRQRILAQEWSLKVFTPLHDIDEPQDLRHLPAGWLPHCGVSHCGADT
ncbi:TIGR04282 family arsenosugar biosynthesis glycosyltransferase [Dasania sp. GY-MA-18]|uniref:TIGR04282 family arsenosugar biosynthesis glycosyltransferase n=1 Tax=Dasania phycosphaerae TaxID=2950436 RepID=A0A9J6RIP0_9GAMM|nr:MULTISPECIES: TIGR04282 family arsenosugar biosynthesis glycosyltransferase [Dasania]MCR8921872.1 TIGR04282 family arsenosugar biosynthesis glycosyltransferase [Dasania sp. GY-MA-18]MCZ0864300.1 TIGR04282 family arsenosugar biosynthesis glycosyltransferase [Dasania phycosphaerae]MCZ0868028.1 TIGR04282 family arsenosugar biosynthesis glycosyltransferase [Dasania phycosphaerae]